ncbi:MAG: hypothetical protein P1U32_00450 [Legionellaceae bacterium]|nr:hypothetical protein [Legionellaceae bacterium]
MDVIIDALKATDEAHIRSMALVRLLKAFGYTDEKLPVADLLARYYGLSGAWAVVSPIRWEATHNDAVMVSSEAVSRDVFDAFQAFLAEADIALYYHDASTWLLQCDKPLPETKPLHAVLAHSMRPSLKALDATPFWLRFLTEAQMFLSGHQGAANGVWLWGGGACDMPIKKPLLVFENERWVDALRVLSEDVSLYQPTHGLARDTVCFMPQHTEKYLNQLVARSRKQVVSWSFNDTTYTTKPKRFWARLWGMKDAH